GAFETSSLETVMSIWVTSASLLPCRPRWSALVIHGVKSESIVGGAGIAAYADVGPTAIESSTRILTAPMAPSLRAITKSPSGHYAVSGGVGCRDAGTRHRQGQSSAQSRRCQYRYTAFPVPSHRGARRSRPVHRPA